MPETILCLDLGAHAVKALLAECRGRTDLRVLAVKTVARADGADLDGALKELASGLQPLLQARFRTAVMLPASEAMFRLVRLPFRDEARIKKTLSFELETLLPLPPEEVAADPHSWTGQYLRQVLAARPEAERRVVDPEVAG